MTQTQINVLEFLRRNDTGNIALSDLQVVMLQFFEETTLSDKQCVEFINMFFGHQTSRDMQSEHSETSKSILNEDANTVESRLFFAKRIAMGQGVGLNDDDELVHQHTLNRK